MFAREEAIGKMNELGTAGIPFFFFTDFLGNNAYITRIDEIDSDELAFSFGDKSVTVENNSFEFSKSPLTFDDFLLPFQKVVDQINYGNSYLVNLTFETPITTDLTIDKIFKISSAKYKVRYKNEFVVFSPETFVKMIDGKVYSYPMKGTIDASIPNAEHILLTDPKEVAEHVTIVDLIRNDLSQIARNVSVPKFRFISEVKTHEKTLLQVSSEIQGDLETDFQKHLGTNLFKLLPAGSISGAPKKETVRIIEEAEDFDRNFYTGVCGVFDGKNMDSGVMIRFIENQDGKLVYKSGGGITSFSKAKSEYQEIIDKVYIPK